MGFLTTAIFNKASLGTPPWWPTPSQCQRVHPEGAGMLRHVAYTLASAEQIEQGEAPARTDALHNMRKT